MPLPSDDAIRLQQRIECGDFDCLLAYCCTLFFELHYALNRADVIQGALLSAALKRRGPGCGPTIVCATTPGGMTTPSNPSTPANPANPANPGATPNCSAMLKSALCKPDVQLKLAALSIIVNGVIAIANTAGGSLPYTSAFYTQVSKFIQTLVTYCSDPAATPIDSVITIVCVTWPTVKAGIDKLKGNSITAPLGSALEKLTTGDVGTALDSCCPNSPAPVTQMLPASAVMAARG